MAMSTAQIPPSGAFSTAGEEAINRTVEIRENELTSTEAEHENIEDLFEIPETVQCIIDKDYRQIALQFPDELLGISVPIYQRLKQLLGEDRSAYVLADTTYGSCCVDEVAAAHIDADVVVHYGHACLSPTSRLPVIYVFGKRYIDIDYCADQFLLELGNDLSKAGSSKTIIVKTDVSYAHSIRNVGNALRERFPSNHIIAPDVPTRYTPPPSSSTSAPHAPADPDQPSGPMSPQHPAPLLSTPIDSTALLSEGLSTKDCIIFYVGGESLALTNFLLTHSSSEVISYDPRTRRARHETGSVNKLLMRRYAIIQRARDADVIGILVGTLGVASYLPLMAHLRRLISKAQKKCYTISVGKLNPAKLANFIEIECFVLVACPENSVIDSKEFYRPIVTPFELEIALRADQKWTGEYILRFDQILARQQEEGKESALCWHPRENTIADSSSTAVALRNNEGALSQVVANAGSDFLHSRSFQGLEQRLGQDAPAVLEQGRSGIAKGYQDVDHAPTS
ncbi:hypothetical protein CTheo_1427 [Ceratobasidium theobromae]|uniref:2-(3-amino-3-carboxypropyl)histidine synthase subunit 2 n=1 Tax=Ceratobasidium theobromae TaxID=1582974 RepID=A0A5N5QU34_9AGAM|nr:hypothetical protein CTheo_1427 [Ceratobasidium theobromae]